MIIDVECPTCHGHGYSCHLLARAALKGTDHDPAQIEGQEA